MGPNCFSKLTGERRLAAALSRVYDGRFRAIDCWIGGMAEQVCFFCIYAGAGMLTFVERFFLVL